MKRLKITLGLSVLAIIAGGALLIAVNFPSVGNGAVNPAPVATPPATTTIPVFTLPPIVTPTSTPAPKPKPIPAPVQIPTPTSTPVPPPPPPPAPAPTPTSTPTSTVKSYSLSEVALHGTAQSCWTAINGSVYDLTPFVNQHPGGLRTILSLCGIDGTDRFLNQHEGQRRPEAELQSLFIGLLK